MKKILFAGLISLSLAACGETPEPEAPAEPKHHRMFPAEDHTDGRLDILCLDGIEYWYYGDTGHRKVMAPKYNARTLQPNRCGGAAEMAAPDEPETPAVERAD